MNEEERSNLYIYTYSDLDDDFIFAETKYTLGDLHKLQQENKQLKGSLQTYEILLRANVEENQNLKEQLQQKQDIINKAKEYIKNHKRNLIHEITHEEYEMLDEENIVNLLEILDNKGE